MSSVNKARVLSRAFRVTAGLTLSSGSMRTLSSIIQVHARMHARTHACMQARTHARIMVVVEFTIDHFVELASLSLNSTPCLGAAEDPLHGFHAEPFSPFNTGVMLLSAPCAVILETALRWRTRQHPRFGTIENHPWREQKALRTAQWIDTTPSQCVIIKRTDMVYEDERCGADFMLAMG